MARLPAGMSKRKDGTIMCRFTVEGKRYTVYGQTVKECREKELQKREKIAAGLYKSGKVLTVAEYADQYIDSLREHDKATTIYNYGLRAKSICGTVIDGSGRKFGELKLDKVEVQNIRDLQKALADNGISSTGINSRITFLSCMYKAAVTERICSWNPVKGVKAMKRTEEKARDTNHRALTREETAAFLDEARRRGSWFLNQYILMLNTGMRNGEAAALAPVHISGNGIKVCRTLTRTETGAFVIGEEAKTEAGRRYIPLNEDARKAITDQMNIERHLRGGKVIDLDAPIFRGQKGGLVQIASINLDIKRICEAAGIEKFSVHAFRDTFATRCIESGMPAKVLMEIMGHTNIQMTLGLYAHVVVESKNDHMKAVNFF